MNRFLRSPWPWIFLGGVLLLTLIRPLLMRVPPPPPTLGSLGEFSLVAADGRSFGAERLRGKTTIVAFFFTRCPSICPVIMHAMKRLQDEIVASGEPGVRLLSVSVDPEYDTPERLRAYGQELGVDPAHWDLATGEPAEIRRLASEGFRVPVGDPAPSGAAGLIDIAHTGKLVLVDAGGEIRGYYDTDSLGLDEAWSRARQVSRERPR